LTSVSFLEFPGGGATPLKVFISYFSIALATAERERDIWAEMAVLEAPASDIPRIYATSRSDRFAVVLPGALGVTMGVGGLLMLGW
jgi:hypothetical protein